MLYDNGPLAVERQANAAQRLGSFASILVLAVRQVKAALAEGFTSLLDALGALVEHSSRLVSKLFGKLIIGDLRLNLQEVLAN